MRSTLAISIGILALACAGERSQAPPPRPASADLPPAVIEKPAQPAPQEQAARPSAPPDPAGQRDDETQRSRPEPAATSCPLELPEASLASEVTSDGAALIFTTSGDVASLRRRVAELAQRYNAGDPAVLGQPLAGVRARIDHIADGVRLVFAAPPQGGLLALREQVRDRAKELVASCPSVAVQVVRGEDEAEEREREGDEARKEAAPAKKDDNGDEAAREARQARDDDDDEKRDDDDDDDDDDDREEDDGAGDDDDGDDEPDSGKPDDDDDDKPPLPPDGEGGGMPAPL